MLCKEYEMSRAHVLYHRLKSLEKGYAVTFSDIPLYDLGYFESLILGMISRHLNEHKYDFFYDYVHSFKRVADIAHGPIMVDPSIYSKGTHEIILKLTICHNIHVDIHPNAHRNPYRAV